MEEAVPVAPVPEWHAAPMPLLTLEQLQDVLAVTFQAAGGLGAGQGGAGAAVAGTTLGPCNLKIDKRKRYKICTDWIKGANTKMNKAKAISAKLWFSFSWPWFDLG